MRINGVTIKGQIVGIKSGAGKKKDGFMVTILQSDGNGGADTVRVYCSKMDPSEKLGAAVEYKSTIISDDMFVLRS